MAELSKPDSRWQLLAAGVPRRTAKMLVHAAVEATDPIPRLVDVGAWGERDWDGLRCGDRDVFLV